MPYLREMSPAQIRAWLIRMGHDPAKAAKLKLVTRAERVAAMKALHRTER